MRLKVLVFASVFLQPMCLAPVEAGMSEATLRKEASRFETADARADARKAFASGDWRFLCVTGEGVWAPGLSSVEFRSGVTADRVKKPRFRIIDETYDEIDPRVADAMRQFKKAAQSYAWAYNVELKNQYKAAHKTLAQHLGCDPKDFRIEVIEWAHFADHKRAKPTQMELDSLRKDFDEFVIISEEEAQAMMVSLVGSGTRRGKLRVPGGVEAEWIDRNFIFVKYRPTAGADEIKLRLAPRGWLDLISW